MEYTEEEKKAFETLEYFEPDDLVECSIYLKSIKTIKKLIDKQQKEIERLYKDNYRLDRENQLKFERAVDISDYIPKEAIREKIKQYESLPNVAIFQSKEPIIRILKELLGE